MNGVTGNTRVLILTGNLGDGHLQAARALLEAAHDGVAPAEAEIVDFMQWTHPRLHSVGRYCYLQWIRRFPSMYGYLYQKTRDDNSLSQLFKKMKLFRMGRMLQLLEEKRPDVVVSTFPAAAAAMSMLKAHGLTTVPTVTVITDHTDHSYWTHPYTDRYLVGSEDVREGLSRQQVPDSLISVTGIPIRSMFGQSYNRIGLREQHGLDPARPTVLVMGGGLGMIGRDWVELLLGPLLPDRLQFIFVCGRNEKLREQLTDDLRLSKHVVHTLGYVDCVHELMACADLLVTKPGGLTTAEAIACELPMLLVKPLPGQEQDNAAFLVRSGLAHQAENLESLAAELINLFQNPLILTTIKERAKKHPMKTASVKAIAAIVSTRNTDLPLPEWKRAAYAQS